MSILYMIDCAIHDLCILTVSWVSIYVTFVAVCSMVNGVNALCNIFNDRQRRIRAGTLEPTEIDYFVLRRGAKLAAIISYFILL